MADLFISYAHEDEARIQPLAYALEQQGWSVFWDRHIPAGQTWRSYIGQALIDARCVIVAWSQHSITSRWVAEEAEEGQKRGILVPVLLDSVEPPIGFRSIQAADLTNWQPDRPSSRFEKLVRDINAGLKSSPTPPATEHTARAGITSVAPPPSIAPQQSEFHWHRGWTLGAIAAIVIVLAVGAYWGFTVVLQPQEEDVVAPQRQPSVKPSPSGTSDTPRMQSSQQALQDFQNEDIHFDPEKDSLRPDALAILDKKVALLKENLSLRIQVEGHTDGRGTSEKNMMLGERMAHAVKQYLVAAGISEGRISTISYGEERPLDRNYNKEAWARNRRVHFVITGQ